MQHAERHEFITVTATLKILYHSFVFSLFCLSSICTCAVSDAYLIINNYTSLIKCILGDACLVLNQLENNCMTLHVPPPPPPPLGMGLSLCTFKWLFHEDITKNIDSFLAVFVHLKVVP